MSTPKTMVRLFRIMVLLSVAHSQSGRSVAAIEPCRILIIDQSNGWPVPMVELETTHHVRFVSDNAGVIAFDLPELMDVSTWLTVRADGYSVAKDRFGYAGIQLTPRAGQTLTVKVRREMAAQRLGRLTGLGLFAESQKLGDELDWKDQGIAGCDSVQTAIHNGRLHWGWGDTLLAKYPLGRYHMTGATTKPRPLESIQPPLRLRYDYWLDEQQASRDVARLPGDGPTWLSGYGSLPDKNGVHRLVASYSKIQPPLDEYETGLCVWSDSSESFEKIKVLWNRPAENRRDFPQPHQSPPMPRGHMVNWTDENQQQWILFGDPFPTLRCPATFEAWSSPESWSPIEPQSEVPVRGSSRSIRPHRGAIAWNEYRRRWVTIFTEYGGDSSHLGETWYAEADSPIGPWQDAIKVATHDNYTFYNPKLHSSLVEKNSPVLLFEATYTTTFSEAPVATPRYDYNQIMYRLDLDQWPWD